MTFAPLGRPESVVKVETNAASPQSDGFNYPVFRLLNKQSRVTLSPETLVPANVRRVFATASVNGGWFAASTSNGLIVAPLNKLRDAFKRAGDELFQSDCTLPCNPVAVAFASNDTRLLAGTADGRILVYDTAAVFSSNGSVATPQIHQASSSPPLQILPNPSSDNELAQLVAIVRADGTVEMLDMQLNTRGAWRATDPETTPVAASWSPKGKQLAIGLRSGDILTFGITNNAAPLKHLPPTASGTLVSLNWLGPTFTFRTSYASNDPAHHIVSLNTQSNTASVVQLTHPFPLPDRQPNAHVLVLSRWDKDDRSLVIVGDTSSTDLEILGSAGPTWFQQSQENPLNVPLDKNDEDTFLLALDFDLTDEMPVMYAYLNDGTVQAWHISHPEGKQYPGLVPSTNAPPTASAFGQQVTSSSSFAQSPAPAQPASAFGQPAFGQSAKPTSTFGQSTFGKASTPAFGQSAFGASATSAFGSSSPNAFGTSSSNSFGSNSGGFAGFASSSSGFGSSQPIAPPMSSTPSVSMGEDSGSAFGGLSLGGSSPGADAGSKPAAGGLFGSFNSSPSPLPLPPNHPANQTTPPPPANFSDPALSKPAAGFGAFGAVTTGAFGNPTSATPAATAFSVGSTFGGGSESKATSSASPAFGTSGFGQSGFGFGQKSTFGQSAFGAASTATGTTPSTGGFGAFAATGPSAFTKAAGPASTSTGGFSAFASQTPSAFGQSSASTTPSSISPPASGGGTGTAAPSFGAAPASPFGQSSATSSPPNTSPSGTAAPVFATNSPHAPAGAFSNLKPASTGFKPAAGFGAFGGGTAQSSPFFKAASPAAPGPSPVSAFSLGGTANKSPSASPHVSGSPSFGSTSALGTPKSAFAPISSSPSSVSTAFSNFTSSNTGFAAAATPAKSFSDLLKVGDDKPKEMETPAPATSSPPVKRSPVFSAPPKEPEPVAPPRSATPPADIPPNRDGAASGESSVGSLSFSSQTSSFVEVTGDEADNPEEGEEDEDDGVPDEEDFLSESFGSDSEGPPDEYSRSPSPSAIPLPASRSPSSTPRGEVSKLEQSSPTQSEDEESDDSEASRLSTIREESETPPGSPEKKPSPPTKIPLAAPIPLVPSPFGIGLGRPSTRPTKSSPLAATPTTGDEPTIRARPASPKTPFGTLPTSSKNEDTTPKPPRPKTPPLSAFSFGGSKTPTTGGPSGSPSPSANSPLPPFPNLAKAPPPTPGTPPGAPPPTFGGSFFGAKSAFPSPVPTTSMASEKAQKISQSTIVPKPQPPASADPELTMAEGMQKECAILVASISRELDNFRALAQMASQKRSQLSKSAGGSRRPSDLGERSKWSLADAVLFGQTMRLYEQDLEDLKETRTHFDKQIRELESNLLKAGTRREEIGRFLKAQNDADFAKMVKVRTLGPEHLETQTQLRRSIRTIQDRVQKLESHLQESKKRLNRASAGNPGLRAPTLDTLNRTFRNMDLALETQTNDVEQLVARVAKLRVIQPKTNGRETRDARLPDPISRQRPLSVTPHVAVTTAAALNAERSAHKLKRVLLSVRKEPLLNTQAAAAPPAPLAFQTPLRSGGINLGLGAHQLVSTPPQDLVGFDFPEDNFNPSSPLPSTRRGGGGTRSRVSSSVSLKRSPGQAPATPSPPAFDWGPLPDFGKGKAPESSAGAWLSGFKGFGTT
ncbi:hypothetical protein MKEN_00327400 [Mycena kentingensis (nom. inval.)]|nr:hypothetical protein MKEN_00327400 [Mycena kentingensis (nom. inval.)]